ncbi:hypothetical protein BGZ60DRAFT_513925 [Tricladium varicosporioides]|nr:hypothetical protein BGZ60DRAFT_513925 [Hymenoscyphus varicosporioides]
MLTVYRPPPKEESDNPKKVVPAGTIYLTKVNGKLVMARAKRDKTADVSFDLMGEVFGANKISTIRKKAESVSASSSPPPPLFIGGIPYLPQHPLQTAPMLQPPFPPPTPTQPFYIIPPPPPQPPVPLQMPHVPQGPYYPPCPPQPTPQDFRNLKQFDAHFNRYVVEKSEVKTKPPNKVAAEEAKTTITITKHICVNCGRVRSKGYHKDHPLRDGDRPVPAFCRRCQRDASSTSSGSRGKKDEEKNPRGKKKKKKKKHKKHRSRPRSVESKSSERDVRRDSTCEKFGIRTPRARKVITLKELSSDEDGRQQTRARRAKENRIVKEIETRHSRGRSRECVEIDYDSHRAPLSPLGRLPERSVSPSDSLPTYYDRLRHSTVGSQLEKSHRSPPVSFRYIPSPSASREEYQEKSTARKMPVHPFDDNGPTPMASYVRVSPVEQQAFSRKTSSRERSSNGENLSSTRSQEVAQLRRQERQSPLGTPWGPQHDIHEALENPVVATGRRVYRPKSELKEKIWAGSAAASRLSSNKSFVVTDTYVYRPKSNLEEGGLLEEERRRQEYADRAVPKGRGSRIKEFLAEDERMRKQYLDGSTVHGRAQARRFSTKEDAVKYYYEDWVERNAESISSDRSEACQRHSPGSDARAHNSYQDVAYESNMSRRRREPQRYRTVPVDEAAKYFREDWDKRGSGSDLTYRGEGYRGYRRDTCEDLELAEANPGYRRESFYQGRPRVPIPPSPIPASPSTESWVAPPFSPRAESITTIYKEKIRRGKAPGRSPPSSVASEPEYERSTTTQHRPVFAWEAIESSLKRALIPSPRNNSRESVCHPYHVSEMTKRIQEVDSNGKRVKFRAEISEVGTTSDWATEEISIKDWPENRSVYAGDWEIAETTIDRGKW